MSIPVFVMAHHSRPHGSVIGQLAQHGITPQVMVDRTSWNKSKDKSKRYLGAFNNFRRCAEAPCDSPWRLICHDDMILAPGCMDALSHVLTFAPTTGPVSFFHPSNQAYRRAYASGKRVFASYSNIWLPFTAFHQDYLSGLFDWCDKHVQPGMISEDGAIWRYGSRNGVLARAVLPSLSQHGGFDKSTFGNPAKAGGQFRTSFTYGKPFDFESVDWKAEFADPFIDNTKTLDSYGLRDL